MRLGAALGLPVTLVDDLCRRPGRVPVPHDEPRQVMTDIVAEDAWVLDCTCSA